MKPYDRFRKLRELVGTGVPATAQNPHFKSKYVDLATLLETVNKPLVEAGLVCIQSTRIEDDGLVLTTRLIDTETEAVLASSEYPVPMDANPQKVGSALTYARRYSLMTVLGLASEDDDGNAAAQPSTQPSTAKPRRKVEPRPEPSSEPDDVEKQLVNSLKDKFINLGRADSVDYAFTLAEATVLEWKQLMDIQGALPKTAGRRAWHDIVEAAEADRLGDFLAWMTEPAEPAND